MNANENIRKEAQDSDIVELGVASVDTKGMGVGAEILTQGENPIAGISDQ